MEAATSKRMRAGTEGVCDGFEDYWRARGGGGQGQEEMGKKRTCGRRRRRRRWVGLKNR